MRRDHTSYPIPSGAELSDIKRRFLSEIHDAYFPWTADSLLHKRSQWPNAIIAQTPHERELLMFNLLAYCPEEEWIATGIERVMLHLNGKSHINNLTVTGIMIRSLYFMYSDKQKTEEYFFTMLATIAFAWSMWNWLREFRTPTSGTPIYFEAP